MNPNQPDPTVYQAPAAAPQPQLAASPIYQEAVPASSSSSAFDSTGSSGLLGFVALGLGLVAVILQIIFDFTSSGWKTVYIPIAIVALLGLVVGCLAAVRSGSVKLVIALALIFSGVMGVVSLNSIASSIKLQSDTSKIQKAEEQAKQAEQKQDQQLQQQLQQ